MTTMSVVGECFFWYRLTRVVPDNFHRAVKRLCVCVCNKFSYSVHVRLSVLDYKHKESSKSVTASGRRADDCRLTLHGQTKTAKVENRVVSIHFMFNWPLYHSDCGWDLMSIILQSVTLAEARPSSQQRTDASSFVWLGRQLQIRPSPQKRMFQDSDDPYSHFNNASKHWRYLPHCCAVY